MAPPAIKVKEATSGLPQRIAVTTLMHGTCSSTPIELTRTTHLKFSRTRFVFSTIKREFYRIMYYTIG